MSYLIAVTGKGGVGKSTIASLLVRLLLQRDRRPVLAVDADPNSTLAPLLGLTPCATIGDIREDVLNEKANVTGISKDRILDMKLEECIQEASGFDLLSMGRPEGPSCYCYVNSLLRNTLAKLTQSYKATVVDNEAGMEHLSRLNTRHVDCLLLVSEPTAIGARTAIRIAQLTESLPIEVGRRVLVWNKVSSAGIPKAAEKLLSDNTFDAVTTLPSDEVLAALSINESSILTADVPESYRTLLDACCPDRAATEV